MPISDDSTGENEDSSLLANASAGDSNALDRLMTTHMDWLLRNIQGKLSKDNPCLSAEDIFQDTLTKAFVSFYDCKFDSILAFKRWLSKIAFHSIADASRWQARKKRGGDFRQVFANGESEDSIFALLGDLGVKTPSSLAVNEENRREIETALATLQSRERDVIELYYFGNRWTEKKIADQLSLSRGRISHIRRGAMAKLRDALAQSSMYFG